MCNATKSVEIKEGVKSSKIRPSILYDLYHEKGGKERSLG